MWGPFEAPFAFAQGKQDELQPRSLMKLGEHSQDCLCHGQGKKIKGATTG